MGNPQNGIGIWDKRLGIRACHCLIRCYFFLGGGRLNVSNVVDHSDACPRLFSYASVLRLVNPRVYTGV